MATVKMGRTQKDVLVGLIDNSSMKMNQAEEGQTLPAKSPSHLQPPTSIKKEGQTMVNVKGINTSRKAKITQKCIESFDPVDRKICECLISVGDFTLESSEKEYLDGGDDQ